MASAKDPSLLQIVLYTAGAATLFVSTLMLWSSAGAAINTQEPEITVRFIGDEGTPAPVARTDKLSTPAVEPKAVPATQPQKAAQQPRSNEPVRPNRATAPRKAAAQRADHPWFAAEMDILVSASVVHAASAARFAGQRRALGAPRLAASTFIGVPPRYHSAN